MTVTLDLKPEVMAQAKERGLPVEETLTHVIVDPLDTGEENSLFQTASPEGWEAALDEFANSSSFDKPASFLDDSRGSIYRDREASQL